MTQLLWTTVGNADLVAETGEFRLIVQEVGGHARSQVLACRADERGPRSVLGSGIAEDVGAAMEAAVQMVGRSVPHTGVAERILLVEDDDLVRDVLGAMLEEAGFSVDSLASPQHALALPQASFPPPAVLVTDVYLGPGMDGFALA